MTDKIAILILLVLFLIFDYISARDIKEILIIQSNRIDVLKYRIDKLEEQSK